MLFALRRSLPAVSTLSRATLATASGIETSAQQRLPSKRLPVYTEFKNNNRTLTIVRKIQGNPQALASDLQRVLHDKEIVVRKQSGHVVVKGNHVLAIRKWLTEVGF